MDQPNLWARQQEHEELAYMYQQEEQPGMQQQFAEPPHLEQQEQRYASSPMANPFHPPRGSNFHRFGGSALPSTLPFGAVTETVKSEQGQQPSPSSSNHILSFGGRQGSSTLDFSGGAWQQDDGGGMKGMQQLVVPEKRTRATGNEQEHVIAERRRREKLRQQFVALATIVPGLKKTDKISVLGSTIDYVKQLEEKVNDLEEHGGTRRTAEHTTVFESKCCISADNADASGPSGGASGDGELGPAAVEASIRGNTALLKICCKERRGVLVMVLSELENQGLSIINTNVVSFTDSCLNITVTAKIEEGFSSAVELVKNLNMALRGFN